MIHFFLTFSDNAADSPFGRALRDLGVAHRIISRKVLLRYKRRAWLLLVGLPTLAWHAARAAWVSMSDQAAPPTAIVVNSHLEVLVFAAVRAVLRRRCRLVLLGFIFTSRPQAWLDRLRRAYLGTVFGLTDGIICFSSLERERYAKIFPAAARKFVHIPYGLHIDGWETPAPAADPTADAAFSAGRSGRDYRTLFAAFAASGHPLRVACDSEQALAGCSRAPNIKVLRDCYDDAFSEELRRAGMVIVPLAVDDISAGQMVALQAMAFTKPIVVTRTATIEEYLRHEREALLVPPGDAAALGEAVERLRTDPALARQLGENAYKAYAESHSMLAFVSNIVRAVGSLPPGERGA